jgi:hypothetical protein
MESISRLVSRDRRRDKARRQYKLRSSPGDRVREASEAMVTVVSTSPRVVDFLAGNPATAPRTSPQHLPAV